MSELNIDWALELHGGDGNDRLVGTNGRDLLSGGGGNDRLIGKAGNDRMFGGDGNDKFLGGEGKDYMNGGAGHDGVDYAQSGSAVTVNLATGRGYGGHAEGDRLASIETVVGSNYDDVLKGAGGNEVLYGIRGNDAIFGKSGNDFLSGGRGHDSIDGGNGNDRMFGDGGNDLLIGRAGNDIMMGGAGSDRIFGGNERDILKGGGGNDVLVGQIGNDKLIGGGGHDTMRGGAGSDTLKGLRGNDTIDGGDGTDTAVLRGSSADYSIMLNGDGSLTVAGGPDGTDTLNDVERLNFRREAGSVEVSDLFNPATETVYSDHPQKVQHLLGSTGNDVFEFSGESSGFDWDATRDGESYVVWNQATGSHDVLTGFEAIRFDDLTVRLTGTASEYTDMAGVTQYLHGSDLTDRFLVNGSSSEFNFGPTLDGKDIVIWNDAGFDILYDFEEIRFSDTTVVIDDMTWA